mgnify:CR=1 FL=1
MDEWINEWMNEWMNERMNERTNALQWHKPIQTFQHKTILWMFICCKDFKCETLEDPNVTP